MSTHAVNNYTFSWTSLHLPKEHTDALRHDYDELGSQASIKLQEIARQKKKTSSNPQEVGKADMYTSLRQHHASDETLQKLWTEMHTVPDWVDWAQIERGQKFFYRYAPGNVLGFALQGFVGENSAASGVVEVLVRTGGFSTKSLLRRLQETFQFVLQVTQSLDSIKPGGTGHTAAVRVRLLHSAVRERIHKLLETQPDYFDVEKFGVPINTLDSIHSIATFCCNHMWLQLPLMGVYPSYQEMADYIALFRYVGYLLATPNEYFCSVEQAKATMESMLLHELHITPTSRIVGHNFVEAIKDQEPLRVSAGFIEAGSRVLNGDALCDSLGIGKPGVMSYICFRGHCWFVATLALVQQTFPSADEAIISFFRAKLHRYILDRKVSLGHFSHVPQIGKLTGKESSGPAKVIPFHDRLAELFDLAVFAAGCVLMLMMAIGLLHLINCHTPRFGFIWNM